MITSVDEFIDKYKIKGQDKLATEGVDILRKRSKRQWVRDTEGIRLRVVSVRGFVYISVVENFDYMPLKRRMEYRDCSSNLKLATFEAKWRTRTLFQATIILGRDSTVCGGVEAISFQKTVNLKSYKIIGELRPVFAILEGTEPVSDITHITAARATELRRLLESYVCSSTPEANDYTRLEGLLGYRAGKLFVHPQPIEARPLLITAPLVTYTKKKGEMK